MEWHLPAILAPGFIGRKCWGLGVGLSMLHAMESVLLRLMGRRNVGERDGETGSWRSLRFENAGYVQHLVRPDAGLPCEILSARRVAPD